MWQRVFAAVLLAMAAGSSLSQVEAQSITGSPAEQLDGRVYVLRGDLGIFFSTGMDYLAAELNSRGLTAGVYNWENWIALADDAIARYRAAPDRTRILLVGHSRGGDGLIAMAWRLHSAHVPVALAVAFDPTRVVGKVPPNVERFINLYQSTNSLGGGAARPSRAFHGEYATVNLAERYEMSPHHDRQDARPPPCRNPEVSGGRQLWITAARGGRADRIPGSAGCAHRGLGQRHAHPRRGRRYARDGGRALRGSDLGGRAAQQACVG